MILFEWHRAKAQGGQIEPPREEAAVMNENFLAWLITVIIITTLILKA